MLKIRGLAAVDREPCGTPLLSRKPADGGSPPCAPIGMRLTGRPIPDGDSSVIGSVCHTDLFQLPIILKVSNTNRNLYVWSPAVLDRFGRRSCLRSRSDWCGATMFATPEVVREEGLIRPESHLTLTSFRHPFKPCPAPPSWARESLTVGIPLPSQSENPSDSKTFLLTADIKSIQ